MNEGPIGIFDSGYGGLSVLQSLMQRMPNENYIFLGDNAHAPYGERGRDEIIRLSMACCERLLAAGAKAIVIACNTASSAAREALRAAFDVPIIAMEPAVRPAAMQYLKHGRGLVLATQATLSLTRYHELVEELGVADRFCGVPCPRFVELVEAGAIHSPQMEAEIASALMPFKNDIIDVIVLGCTHFVLIREQITRVAQQIFTTDCRVIDGNDGTALQVQRRLRQHNICTTSQQPGRVLLWTSGEESVFLPQMQKYLNM